MKKYTKEYCRQNKVAIIINSSEEVIQVAKIIDKYNEGYGWWSYFYDAFRHTNNEHCISYNNGYGVHASKEYYDTQKEYEVITFQQFIQDNEEFVLPEKWHIVVYNEEQANVYRKFFNEKANTYWDYFFNYVYGFNGKQYVAAERNTEITFDQFCKYVLKEETNMKEKEIIGYKLIKPQYEEAACKIAEVIDLHIYPSGWSFQVNTSAKLKLEKAGVLDIWFEPVYKEEKKLPKINGYDGKLDGDYIIYGSNCARFQKRFFEILEGFHKEHPQFNNNFSNQNRTIKSIKLNSGVEITMEQVKEIVEFLKTKN